MKTESKEIAGRKFTVTQVPGRKGKRLFERIARAIAPAMSKGASGLVDERESGSSRYLRALAEAIPVLLKDLPEAELQAIEDGLFEYAQVDVPDPRKPDEMMRVDLKKAYDEIFTGDPITPYQVMIFAIDVNWGERFFGESGFAPALERMASLFKFPSILRETGSSGVSSSDHPESQPSPK